jgi:hypothetical protein
VCPSHFTLEKRRSVVENYTVRNVILGYKLFHISQNGRILSIVLACCKKAEGRTRGRPVLRHATSVTREGGRSEVGGRKIRGKPILRHANSMTTEDRMDDGRGTKLLGSVRVEKQEMAKSRNWEERMALWTMVICH